jgi:hypothetical protein
MEGDFPLIFKASWESVDTLIIEITSVEAVDG